MSTVWYATWRILARYVGIAAGLTASRIAAIGNLWCKFVPKGHIPLRDFYKIWRGVGSPRSAQSREISPLWLSPPKSSKLVIFHINLPKRGIPLKKFLQNLAWGESPRYAPSRQILPLWLYKCGLAAQKIAIIFGIYLPQRVYPLHQFLQNLAWGRVFQVPTITLTFTFVALKMWPYGRQNRKK